VVEGMRQAMRGEAAALSAEETERYLETGELPEHVLRWMDDESDSPSAT
jgi:hypothetical protein